MNSSQPGVDEPISSQAVQGPIESRDATKAPQPKDKKAKASLVTYSKTSDQVDMNVAKVDKENIVLIVDLTSTSTSQDMGQKHRELIKPKTQELLGIEPRRVRDSEIAKPDEKEPNIFKALRGALVNNFKKDGKDKKDSSSSSSSSSSAQNQADKISTTGSVSKLL